MLLNNFSKKNFCQLKSKLKIIIPQKQNEIKELLKNHGDKVIFKSFNAKQLLEGLPVFYETSSFHRTQGIKFRGHKLKDIIAKTNSETEMKTKTKIEYPSAERLIWTFLTGEIPSNIETKSVIDSMNRRNSLSPELTKM